MKTLRHCDQFSSQHAEPWKAVRSKDEGASSRSGTNKLIEEKAIKETSEPIASPTTLTKTNAEVAAAPSSLDESDEVPIHCKQLDDAQGLQQGDTHGVTRHGNVSTPCKPRTATVTPEPRL